MAPRGATDLSAFLLPGTGGRQTAHVMVREALRRAIRRGALPGGAQLTQAHLAQELGVSITPVREALRDLATEGLVHFDAWKTVTVHRVTAEELAEVYELRAVLESLAIRRACERVTDEDIRGLRVLAQDMRNELDAESWLNRNEDFHEKIAQISGSGRLAKQLESLRGVVSLYVGLSIANDPSLRQASDQEHDALLVALADRDVATATSISHHHMDRTAHSPNVAARD